MLYYSFSRSQSSTVTSIKYGISNRKVKINKRDILISYSHIVPSPLFISTYDTTTPSTSKVNRALEIDDYFLYSDVMGRPSLTCQYKTKFEVSRPMELVVFVHYLSKHGDRADAYIKGEMKNERLVLEAELLALKLIETGAKLPNNLRLTPLIIDGSRGIKTVEKYILPYYRNGMVHYIFTTYTNEDRDNLLETLNSDSMEDIEIVSMRHLNGLECLENTIFSGISVPAKFDIIYSWYLRDSYLPIVIIGSNLYYGRSSSNFFYNQFHDYGYDMDKVFLYQMIDNSDSEGYNAVSRIRSFLFDGIYIYIMIINI